MNISVSYEIQMSTLLLLLCTVIEPPSHFQDNLILQLNCDISNSFRSLTVSTNNSGDNTILWNDAGSQLQIMNIYPNGMGFGHRTEISTLRKMTEMLLNGVPQWHKTELMIMRAFYESTRTDGQPMYEISHFI